MFYNSDIVHQPSTAAGHPAPIVDMFLDALELGLMGPVLGGPHVDWSLDTRSHMLMRGWYPAIPGWHHDDVDRGPTGQPDYDAPLAEGRRMFVCVIDASDRPTGSLTEFFQPGQTVSVPWPVPTDQPVYRYWDAHIERESDAERFELISGAVYEFGPGDFHRALPARSDGWRWFARLTINPGPRPAEPKIRRQAQVYLPVTNLGW